MNPKAWSTIWFGIVISSIPAIFVFNYVIDPWGTNNEFSFKLNTVKQRNDERTIKFELIKQNPKAKNYIFGSSRSTIIDPERISLYTKGDGLNTSFSSATIDEIESYVDWLLKHRNPENIFIAIDLFGFSEDFMSNGTMPEELRGPNWKNPLSLKNYISSSMFVDSLKVLAFNAKGNQKISETEQKYLQKGMRYYGQYLDIKTEKEKQDYIKKKVTAKAVWHVNSFSMEKINILNSIHKKLKAKNVSLFLFTNPLLKNQILKDNNFLTQLKLLKTILKTNKEITIVDFNNMNEANFNYNLYVDDFHYDYEVANCIVDRLFRESENCFNNFGKVLNSENVEAYTASIEEKWQKMKL